MIPIGMLLEVGSKILDKVLPDPRPRPEPKLRLWRCNKRVSLPRSKRI